MPVRASSKRRSHKTVNKRKTASHKRSVMKGGKRKISKKTSKKISKKINKKKTGRKMKGGSPYEPNMNGLKQLQKDIQEAKTVEDLSFYLSDSSAVAPLQLVDPTINVGKILQALSKIKSPTISQDEMTNSIASIPDGIGIRTNVNKLVKANQITKQGPRPQMPAPRK